MVTKYSLDILHVFLPSPNNLFMSHIFSYAGILYSAKHQFRYYHYHDWINESTHCFQVFALTFYLTLVEECSFFPYDLESFQIFSYNLKIASQYQ